MSNTTTTRLEARCPASVSTKRTARLLHDAEQPRDNADHRGRVAERGQLAPPHAVGVVVVDLGHHLQRKTCLADAARPGEREDPGLGQRPLQLPHLTTTAHEARQHGRQVPERPVEGTHRREPVRQVTVGHLPQRDRLGHVPQPVRPEAAEADALGDPVPGKLHRHVSAQDLASPTGRHDPCGPVQRRTEVVTPGLHRLA